ncbi:bifunctional phosphoribosyl-AMP cyclohydrolase/phosphoribosyl-ATP diphosphatase HisIE [Halalkalibacillus halophilus]|uniref:bifunctional phosphoribosyl-AMP cyclohydrolase/phosphoribosyl-ATP diphosphatase HisIE n=1 Tax=Halalkalibacillus halophilus TaxID=392827 RepID=UPI0004864842|nr:bifunctional phosphoribosyl-AMP cyclohydrolase/phosphoribosyl-ATP diphosphatase HisIE [Halalkalibacillus halophilus]
MRLNSTDFNYDDRGLIPAVVQHVRTGEVLMLAYMNDEAVKRTIESKTAWFFSRSRDELWNKGATSGNIQHVKSFDYDCDEDTILLKVEPEGPACHTGEHSCFYRSVELQNETMEYKREVIHDVFASIQDRKKNPQEGSYTTYLQTEGVDKILKKISEEAGEILIGAKNDDNENLSMEIADLIYHVLVLMGEKEVSIEQVKQVLTERMKG